MICKDICSDGVMICKDICSDVIICKDHCRDGAAICEVIYSDDIVRDLYVDGADVKLRCVFLDRVH